MTKSAGTEGGYENLDDARQREQRAKRAQKAEETKRIAAGLNRQLVLAMLARPGPETSSVREGQFFNELNAKTGEWMDTSGRRRGMQHVDRQDTNQEVLTSLVASFRKRKLHSVHKKYLDHAVAGHRPRKKVPQPVPEIPDAVAEGDVGSEYSEKAITAELNAAVACLPWCERVLVNRLGPGFLRAEGQPPMDQGAVARELGVSGGWVTGRKKEIRQRLMRWFEQKDCIEHWEWLEQNGFLKNERPRSKGKLPRISVSATRGAAGETGTSASAEAIGSGE